MSGFGRLPSSHVPGSSHAIGVCAPFTVWAVVPLLRGNNNKHYKNNRDPTCWLGPLIIGKKKPYKNNRDPTCWLGPLIKSLQN